LAVLQARVRRPGLGFAARLFVDGERDRDGAALVDEILG